MSLDEFIGSLKSHEKRLNLSISASFKKDFGSQVSLKSRGISSNNRGVAKHSGSGSGRFNNNHEGRCIIFLEFHGREGTIALHLGDFLKL